MAYLTLRAGSILICRPNILPKLLIRCGHHLRGKAPGVAKTLVQRLRDENISDTDIIKPVNIGFPYTKPSRSSLLSERLQHIKAQRNNIELERLSREQKLQIDIEQVRTDWLGTSGPFHIRRIAEHYGVYEHLFGAAYFVPRVELNIQYHVGELIHPVRYGNILKPSETTLPPRVQFDKNFNYDGSKDMEEEQSWWSLVLTNPDGHFEDREKEYCHWFIGNIPREDVLNGEELVPYLQPFPPKGTGYHRHIFLLYRQKDRIDFSQYRLQNTYDLPARTFCTLDFYRQHQDVITPAGLAFFQSDWDASLPEFYHNKLQLQHPVFEYDFPSPYIRQQEWFPLRKPFNLYMDKYRDPAQVRKEYLARKLTKTHPFHGPEPALRYPNAHPVNDVPSWLRTEIKKDRLGWGRVNDV